MTKEGEGAEIATRGRRVSQPAFEIRFVEPSGCGDAFCAGVVYSLMQARQRISSLDANDLAKTLLWGQALGASATTEVGCVAGVTRTNVQSSCDGQKDRLLRDTAVETL